MNGFVLFVLMLAAGAADPFAEADRAREAGKTDEAIALYTKALKAQPGSTEGWWYLGLCYYEKDRSAEAVGAFEKVVAAQPKQGAGWAMLGVTQRGAGKYDEALVSLRKAHSLGIPAVNDLDKVARFQYTALLNRAGQFDVASGLLMTFVSSSSVTPGVKQVAGISALRLAVLPESVPADMAEAVRLAGEASILAWEKRNAEARAQGAALLAKYPSLPNAHYLMGYLLLLSHDQGCIEEFAKAIELQPDHLHARLQIAYEYFKRSELERALPYAAEGAKLAPTNFIAQDIYGRVLLGLDRVDEAVRVLEAAVKLEPGSAEAHFHLASAYTRSGRREEAARHREIFAKLDKERQR